MSDISIPGVSSNLNTDKIVANLMKLEQVPLNRLEQRVTTIQTQRDGWLEINRNISTFRDSARKLYSFDNPFDDKVASSSEPDAVTASAARTAKAGSQRLTVDKLAMSDSFLSNSVANDLAVPAGTYGFTVGGKEITIQYSGGSLADFAQFVTQHSQGLLDASVINDTLSTKVFAIKAKPTGAENKLGFTKDSIQFALTTGLLRQSNTTSRTIDLTPQEVQQ